MAKRNKALAKQSRSGKSPYQKYNKAPVLYSGAYYAWFRENHASGKRHPEDRGGQRAEASSKKPSQGYRMAA